MNQNYQIIYPKTYYERLSEQYQSVLVSDSDFDWLKFYELLFSPLSLSLAEKYQVVRRVRNLSHWQMNELSVVFNDEIVEFQNLLEDEGDIIINLIAQSLVNGVLLMVYLGIINSKEEERQVICQILEHYQNSNPALIDLAKASKEADNVYWSYIFQQHERYQTALTGSDLDKWLDASF